MINYYIVLFSICLLLNPIELCPQTVAEQNMYESDRTNSNALSLYDSIDAKGNPITPIADFTYAGNRRWLIDGTQPFKTTKIKPISAIAFTAAMAGIFYIQHDMQQNTIWKEVGDFNIHEDWQYSYGLDKLGHFYAGFASSYILSEVLFGMGFSWELGTLVGSGLGLLYTSYIEILDGYSVHFGFSPSDFYADFAGATFHSLQYYFPVLQNINPKFMYVNPAWIGENKRIPHETFIDDYSSQTFWFSVNVHNLLPDDAKRYWPKWLELTIGYGVFSLCEPGKNCDQNLSYPFSNSAWGNRSLLIGLDYNLVSLLPEGGSFWNWIRQGLDLFRLLPAPTLQISDRGTNFYFLFPINVKL